MNDHEWGKKLREEADEVWFKDAVFDERLKAQVRERIREFERQSSERDDVARLRRSRWRWGFRAILAASFLAVAAISFNGLIPNPGDSYIASGINDDVMQGAENGEDVTTIMTGDITSAPNDSPEEVFGTLSETEDGIGITDGAEMTEPREVSGLAEASRLFEDNLLVPAEVPEGYAIDRITASDVDQEGMASMISIHYTSADNSFVFTQVKGDTLQPTEYDEIMEMNGTTGYYRITDSHAELHWLQGEVGLSLSGLLDREQMMQIAKSITQYEHNQEVM